MSFALDVQVGAIPGAPNASPGAPCSAIVRTGFRPAAKRAQKRVVVRTQPRVRRQFAEPARVAAAEHDVVGLERGAEQLDSLADEPLPAPAAIALEPLLAEVVLERALAERQVRDLHRLDHTACDQRRSEPGAEPEEEHRAAVVAAERLHGGVIHHLRRYAERGGEVEANPPLPQVEGLRDDAA